MLLKISRQTSLPLRGSRHCQVRELGYQVFVNAAFHLKLLVKHRIDLSERLVRLYLLTSWRLNYEVLQSEDNQSNWHYWFPVLVKHRQHNLWAIQKLLHLLLVILLVLGLGFECLAGHEYQGCLEWVATIVNECGEVEGLTCEYPLIYVDWHADLAKELIRIMGQDCRSW